MAKGSSSLLLGLQIIVKEKGVFSNVTSPSTKAKLRILFEVAPLGLLVEKAGGASSCDGQQKSTLDVLITKHDQVSSGLGLCGAGMAFSAWRAACLGQPSAAMSSRSPPWTKRKPVSCSMCCMCAHLHPASSRMLRLTRKSAS